MPLNPERYECPDHHTDLTGQVEEVLEARGRRSPTGGRRPFQVIVTCPGTGGAGAHPLTCTGTQTP